MNDTEREAIILNSAWEMIDGMVNWANFVEGGLAEHAELTFKTGEHALLFIILLGDFLSQVGPDKNNTVPLGLKPAPSNARSSDLTFLFHLRQVCANPRLGTDTSSLRETVETFADWLEGEFMAQGVNLSDIGIVADLRIKRIRYLKMCADIAKHNLARLATNVHHLRLLLEASGHSVSEKETYLAVENFFTWFHGNIFAYHQKQIAEFLNNMRCSIHDYLLPEFRRSWYSTGKVMANIQEYRYHVPPDITEPLAHAMYWNLMNRSRSEPYMQRFVVSDDLKQRY